MGVLGVMDLAIEMGFAIDKKRLVKQSPKSYPLHEINLEKSEQ